MEQSQLPSEAKGNIPPDSAFAQEIERLYQISVYGRWLVVILLWLTVGMLSLWHLRSQISLLLSYFTWTAVRYSVIYNRFSAVGLAFCIGMTLAVLVWQSRSILGGRPQREQQRLAQQVLQIRKQGPSHPLWKLVRQNQS